MDIVNSWYLISDLNIGFLPLNFHNCVFFFLDGLSSIYMKYVVVLT